MGKHFEIIMNEMCKRVGADWSKVNPKKGDWFMKHTWTEEEENKFIDWFVNYLIKHKEARKEILTRETTSRIMIRRVVEKFVLNYGWKLKLLLGGLK